MSESPFEGFGIPLPLPAELLNSLKRHNEQQHMSAEAAAARVDNFITSLDVDGLLALRSILNQGDMVRSLSANFWDGQIVSILQYVKHVDPNTGKDPLAGVEATDDISPS